MPSPKKDPCPSKAIVLVEKSLQDERENIARIKQQLADLGIQLPVEAKKVSGESTLMDLMEALKNMKVVEVPIGDILTDPKRFQFKQPRPGASGSWVQRMRDVGVGAPLLGERWMGAAEPLIGWKSAEGDIYVVEGHHRLEFAKRLKDKGPDTLPMHILEEAPGDRLYQGIDPQTAKAVGAMSNILQEHGEIEDYIAVAGEGFLSDAEIEEILPEGMPGAAVTTKRDKARLLAVDATQSVRDSLKDQRQGTLNLRQAIGITKGLRAHDAATKEGAASWGIERVRKNSDISGENIGAQVGAFAGAPAAAAGEGDTQLDMFGHDPSIMEGIEAQAEALLELRSEFRNIKKFTKWSSPEAAEAIDKWSKGTMTVTDMEAMGLENESSTDILSRLMSDSWARDPEILAMVMKQAGLEPEAVASVAGEDDEAVATGDIDYAQPVRIDPIITVASAGVGKAAGKTVQRRIKLIMSKDADPPPIHADLPKTEAEVAGHLAVVKEYGGVGVGKKGNRYVLEIAGQEELEIAPRPFSSWNNALRGYRDWAAGEPISSLLLIKEKKGKQSAAPGAIAPALQTLGVTKEGYTGAVVSPESRQRLMEALDIEIPAGWTKYGHHMTTNMGGPGEGTQLEDAQRTIIQGNVGKESKLVPLSIGISDKAIAIEVGSDIPTINETKHITIAVAPGAKPYDSNKISSWETLTKEQQRAIGVILSTIEHKAGGTPEYEPAEAVVPPEQVADPVAVAAAQGKRKKQAAKKAQPTDKQKSRLAEIEGDKKLLKGIENEGNEIQKLMRNLRKSRRDLEQKGGIKVGEVLPEDMARAHAADDRIEALTTDLAQVLQRGGEVSARIERAEGKIQGAKTKAEDKKRKDRLGTYEFETNEKVLMEGVEEPVIFRGVAGMVEGEFSAIIQAGEQQLTVDMASLKPVAKPPLQVSEETVDELDAADKLIEDLFAQEDPC